MSVQPPSVPAHVGFSVRIRPDRERVIVVLGGEFDLATAGRVERWTGELQERGFTSLVLDLRELTFIDSSGLKLLLRLDAAARADGFSFAIIDGEGPVRRLLELTCLTDRFTHAPPPADG